MKKNMLKGWITTTSLVLAMAFNTFGNGGIIVQGFTNNDVKGSECTKVDSGILIGDFGGILIGDLIGILIGDLVKNNQCEEKVNSGILIGD